jgi:hypothetical protein
MWQEPGAGGVRQAPAFARVDREQSCASAEDAAALGSFYGVVARLGQGGGLGFFRRPDRLSG